MKRQILALSLLASCGHSPERKTVFSSNDKVERMAWVSWPDANGFIFCTRRIDNAGNPVGVNGPCWRLDAGETEAKKVFAWAAVGGADSSPANGYPPAWSDRCHFEIERSRLGSKPTPARIWMITPTARELLSEWTPEPTREEKVFALEPSFSPEGKWMAISRVTLKQEEGQRVIEVDAAELREVPACR